jgi:hypothetical protein
MDFAHHLQSPNTYEQSKNHGVAPTETSDGHGYDDLRWVTGTGQYGMGTGAKILPCDVPIPVSMGDGSVTSLVRSDMSAFRHLTNSMERVKMTRVGLGCCAYPLNRYVVCSLSLYFH